MNKKLFIICFIGMQLIYVTKHSFAQQLVAYIETTGAKNEFCANQTIALIGVASGGSGNYVSHEWIDNSNILIKEDKNIAIIKTNKSGDYSITYRVSDDMGSVYSTSVTIRISQGPTGEIVNDNGFVKLKNLQGDSPLNINWFVDNKKVDNAQIPFSLSSKYRVIITDKKGCVFSTDKKFN